MSEALDRTLAWAEGRGQRVMFTERAALSLYALRVWHLVPEWEGPDIALALKCRRKSLPWLPGRLP